MYEFAPVVDAGVTLPYGLDPAPDAGVTLPYGTNPVFDFAELAVDAP